MKKTRYKIEITREGKTTSYTEEFQTAERFAPMWQGVLRRHHGHDVLVRCTCPGGGERKFAIKLRRETDRYFITRYGHTGINHFPECIWYSSANVSGRQAYTEGVVEEEADGNLRVQLAVSLNARNPVEREPRDAAAVQNPRSGRNQSVMKLQGLLHLLWTELNLNVWHPKMGKARYINSVHGWLNAAAARVRAGRTNLNEVLLVGAQKDADPEAEVNRSKVAAAVAGNRRLVIISPLAAWNEARETRTGKVPVRDFSGLPELRVDDPLWSETLRHHPVELAAWRRGERIIAVALTDVPEGRTAAVLRLSLMYVSDRWIPLNSSHEGTVEARLADESRSFMKPLRFDADQDDVFADFHLLDTSVNHLPMEVFGMNTPEYLMRKQIKEVFYNNKYGAEGWWCWDVASFPATESMPAFPEPRVK